MAYIPTGMSETDKLPGTAVEVRYAQGEGSSAVMDRDILLIGDSTNDGYNLDVTQLSNENEAITYFGAKSEIHRMARQVFRLNKNVRVWAVGLDGTAGNAATGTITLATNASAPGNVEVWIAGTRIVQGFAKDDTPTVVASALVSRINSVAYLPVVATSLEGVVTLTASCKGAAGNAILFHSTITSNAGMTVADVAMSTGSGSSDIDEALDKVVNREYYYQISARNDATNVQKLAAQLNVLAEPSTQIRQVGIFGLGGTVASAATITQNALVNSERVQCVQLNKVQTMPEELAAMVGALRAKSELSDWGYNFNGLVLPAMGPVDASDSPTNSDLRTALESGVSPLQVNKFGGVSLVASRTTRCLNGANADYRASQTYVVSVTDAWAKQLQSDLAVSFAGKKVMAESPKTIPGVVQPKHMRAKIIKWLETFTEKPWLDPSKLDEMIESVDVVKSTATLSAQCVLFCAENLDKVFVVALESSDPQ